MQTAYNRVQWGLWLLLLDFRIGPVDILPDLLGAALLLVGLSRLRLADRRFAVALGTAVALTVWSIVDLVKPAPISLFRLADQSFPSMAWATFGSAVHTFLMYGVAAGIARNAARRKLTDLQQSAITRWRFCFAVAALWLLATPFSLNLSAQTMTPLLLALSVAGFITTISIVLLVRRAGRELHHVIEVEA